MKFVPRFHIQLHFVVVFLFIYFNFFNPYALDKMLM